ncbi:MAG: TlpA family protein disulfide reductase, partial [Aeromicrobium sp.]
MTPTSTSAPTSASGPGPVGGTRRRWLAIAGASGATLLVLAVAYTAFGSQPAPAPGAASSAAGSASTAATAFTATTLSGEKVSIPGGKPSVVFFFAASCVTCGSGAQAVAEAQAGVPSVSYVAVDIDPSESEAVVRDFLTDNGAETLAF